MHNKRVFQTLINEVGEWADDNFGANISKWPPTDVPYQTAVLDHTACLLGIIEECGELTEAVKLHNLELIRDSIGDILIYLADYLYRQGLTADTIHWSAVEDGKYTTVFLSRKMLITVGQLAHINLKRHQGIRGYETEKFFYELSDHLTNLLILLRLTYAQTHPKPINPDQPLQLNPYTPQEGTDAIIAIASSTWQHVKERNWKKNPKTGGT